MKAASLLNILYFERWHPPVIFFHLPPAEVEFTEMCNNKAISFTNRYPNISWVQHPVQQSCWDETITPETITLYDFLSVCTSVCFFFSFFLLPLFTAPAFKEQSHRVLLTSHHNEMAVFWWRHLWHSGFVIPCYCVSFDDNSHVYKALKCE